MKEIAMIIGHLAWPVLCIIIFFNLKVPLSKLISNIKSVSGSGVEFNPQINQTNPNVTNESFSDDEYLIPIVKERKDKIKEELDELNCANEAEEKERVITALATSQIMHNFEIIYGIIFASQIILLKKLNTSYNPLTKENIEGFFASFQKNLPDPLSDFTLDSYLKFLYEFELISFSENIYNITKKGIEYLAWMERVGKAEKFYG